jgi:Fur family ferric uptake transcriptional regulator
MTIAPHTRALPVGDIDDAVEALRGRGLRLSMTRQAVLEALFAASGPISAERIAVALGLVETSVYRNLETLERHGLVRHVHLGHGPGLYALVGSGEQEYIYCPACSVARSVRPQLLDPVRTYIRSRLGHEVRFTHFALVGHCATCAQAGTPGPAQD